MHYATNIAGGYSVACGVVYSPGKCTTLTRQVTCEDCKAWLFAGIVSGDRPRGSLPPFRFSTISIGQYFVFYGGVNSHRKISSTQAIRLSDGDNCVIDVRGERGVIKCGDHQLDFDWEGVPV